MFKKTILTAALGVALSTGGAFALPSPPPHPNWSIFTLDFFAGQPYGPIQSVDTPIQSVDTQDADPDSSGMGFDRRLVYGGWREMDIETTNGPFTGKGATTIVEGPGVHTARLKWSNDPGVTSISTLRWDANGAGLGGLDLVGYRREVLLLGLTTSDAGIDIKFTLTDTMGKVSTLAGVTEDNKVRKDFQLFYRDAMGDADLTDIDSISMQLSSTVIGANFTAAALMTTIPVPLPASALLLLGALGGLRLLRRKS